MFNKALFKQSCKANGIMWMIITFAVCFMLASVMLISGSGGIGTTKSAIQDTIITKEIDAEVENMSINYYQTSNDALKHFDQFFIDNTTSAIIYQTHLGFWHALMPKEELNINNDLYQASVDKWLNEMPKATNQVSQYIANNYLQWYESKPIKTLQTSNDDYTSALNTWQQQMPLTEENLGLASYVTSITDIQNYLTEKALKIDDSNTPESEFTKELIAISLFVLNPNGVVNDFYHQKGELTPQTYDINSLANHLKIGDAEKYLASEERIEYINKYCENAISVFIAGNLTEETYVTTIIDALSSFGVNKEKYESFNYNYAKLKHMAKTTIITFQNRLDYEYELIDQDYQNGEYDSDDAYIKAKEEAIAELTIAISSSFLDSLPQMVSDALEEIGKMDLYGLIVGSIFYKLAGLLLPIIYMIMCANNLIVGQIDSGSMAYILSSSVKRKTVIFTQAVYLIGSILVMFILATITGSICLCFIGKNITLTFGKLLLLNLGAFLVLFALSGLCFLTSCHFDRSKRSMAIGGGLSIFALVAAMLGLFGSKTLPSVVRLDALNSFNYVTIISLFDVTSILDGTYAFIGKLIILVLLGLSGYFIGAYRFIKKDLPL